MSLARNSIAAMQNAAALLRYPAVLWQVVTIRCFSLWRFRQKIPASKNKLIIITGCDSGLGYSFSKKCQQVGLRVLSGCLNLDSEGARDLSQDGHVVNLDVRNDDSVFKMRERAGEILEKEGCVLHAVVNNAGIMVFGEFEWQTEEQIWQQIAVNQLGTWRVAKAFLPLLRKYKGRLVNISSHCALSSLPGIAVYGGSKAAVENWSESLRVEQKKYDVDVVTFIPGSFPLQSNILSRQGNYAKQMEEAMSAEGKEFFGNYFGDFHSYLTGLPEKKELIPITDNMLYDKFMHALLDRSPKARYLHEPWRYFLYYNLFRFTPVWLRDLLVVRFVQFPKYKPRV